MAHFLVKLIPPRKTFNDDMTEDERRVVRARADYWLPHLNAGLVIAMGPVADPEGAWWAMIVNMPSRAWLEGVQSEDPAIRAGLGFRYENFVMPALKVAPVEPLAPVSSISP